ncbi:MAG: hypothetical protein ACOY0T_09575 [Myxococcota bacterium]
MKVVFATPAGIEHEAGSENQQETSRVAKDEEPEPPGSERPNLAIAGEVIAASDHQSGAQDAVEAALADALTRAAAAGEWAVVGKLSGELEARRRARAGTVDLSEERARRSHK